MVWTLHHYDGQTLTLPPLTSARIFYALGKPCDSVTLRCPWSPGQEDLLQGLCRISGTYEGDGIFFGILDEWIAGFDQNGYFLEVVGRSLQALLLDNEAVGADYGVATLEDILRHYVTPYGISLHGTANITPVPAFSVKSGSSCWQVLYQFARYHGGISPRFDRYGRLVLQPLPMSGGGVLDDNAPITQMALHHNRFGVLSQVQVQNRTTLALQTQRDDAFLQEGGSCSRVLTVPRHTGFQSMRYSAQFQLRQSGQKRKLVELSLVGAFQAFPGDLLRIERSGFSANGLYRILEATVTLDADGLLSHLVLAPPTSAI